MPNSKSIPAPSAFEEMPAQNPTPLRALVEIAVGYGLILSVVWATRPVQRFLWVIAVAGIAVIVWRSSDRSEAMGFRIANFWRSLWIAGAALVAAAVAGFVAASLHTLRMPQTPLAFVANYCAYAIWAGVQQFLLQSFFLLRCLRLISSRRLAALAAAGLFAAAHLPNPILAPITLLWGVLACLLFLRYRNIYPLMIAHAILGITVAITVPGHVDHNMRVGRSYLTYRPDHLPHRTHWLTKP